MRVQGRPKRMPKAVPIEPHVWQLWGPDEQAAFANAAAHLTMWVRLPKARRAGQRVESKHGRLRLLWCADVTDDLTVCALVPPREFEAIALVLYRGFATADYVPDLVPGRTLGWHQRRAVANAQAAAAVLRATLSECHVTEPMKPADIAWLRRQLETLNS